MRRADWVAVALVGTIVVGVGSMIARAPRRTAPPAAIATPDTVVAADSVRATPDDSSATSSLRIPTGGEVRVKLVRSSNAAPPRDVAEI